MLTHFNIGTLSANFSEGEEGTLVKDALLLVEGTHTDNAGNVHTFSKDRVMLNALNTNEAIARGETIPFKANHSKDVRDDLGEIISDIECRTIGEEDLPNPKFTHLVGKLGAFAKVEIKKNLDDVQRKIIKALSPGIDVARDRLIEVSAVSRPAILGPALFGANGSLSFKQAKEQAEEFKKLSDRLQDNFNVFLSVVQNILAIEENSIEFQSQNTLLQTAVDELGDAIASELDIEDTKHLGMSQNNLYDDNPYADTIVKPNPNNQQFSEEEENLIQLELSPRKKRRRA